MSSDALDSIKEGLEDALEYATSETGGTAHRVEVPMVDVRAVRERLGLSQSEFAKAFGVSVATLRNWEQGRRYPRGPARVLLMIIEQEPDAVQRALAQQEVA
jgi:putative transcriptional regulator